MDIGIGTSVVIYTMIFFISLHVVIADPNDALILNLKKTVQLEVRYKGDWGSICYSMPGFDDNAATITCQQMGFRSGKFGGKTYLPGTNLKIVLQSVTCTGQEDDLSDCRLTAPDASSSCGDAVQVNCESDPALDGLFDANLIGNPDQANKGILQATKRDLVTGVVTGAVCYDSGTAPTVAGIVCKQMGYPGVERQTATSASSSGSFFTAVCKGTEQTLANCSLTQGTKCTSNNTIDVECKLNMTTQATFDVRLSQSSQVVAGVNNGTVEVKKYGKWGVICDTDWDIKHANVVCRQLGFKRAVATTGFPTKAKFGQGTGRVFWNNVQCSGDEQSIEECKHDEVLGTGACNSVDASGVNCSTEKWPIIDACNISSTIINGRVTFIQSPKYPSDFNYNNSTVCKVELISPSNFTIYIQQKMFENNHFESLSFTSNGQNETILETIYGDNFTQGPMTFDQEKLVIEFMANGKAGKGRFNIMVTVPEPPPSPTLTSTPETTPSGTNITTTSNHSSGNPGNQMSPPQPENVGVIVGPIVGVACLIAIIVILVFVVCKKKKKKCSLNSKRKNSVGSADKSLDKLEQGGDVNPNFIEDEAMVMKENDLYGRTGKTPQGVTPGTTDVYAEVPPKWKRNLESKEPETGETKQRNGSIGRPASGSDVKVDVANQPYNSYELEGQPQLNDNPYKLEQPLNKGVESGTSGRSALVDNVGSQQYAVVNKPQRVAKGQAPTAPRAQPHGTITENANQDIDNGNVDGGSEVVPPVVYAEVNKPTSSIPGLNPANADVDIGACGAPSIQPEVPPKQETPEKETKKSKKKKKKKKEEDKEEGKKKDKKGKHKKKKKGLWSSDDVSDERPKGDSFAVPMDNPSAGIYAEVGQTSMGQSGPAGGSQQVESDQTYDVLQRNGPKQRPAANVGVTDQMYESVNYKV